MYGYPAFNDMVDAHQLFIEVGLESPIFSSFLYSICSRMHQNEVILQISQGIHRGFGESEEPMGGDVS